MEVNGRIYVNAFIGAEGEAKASLNCHSNNIKIHTFGKQELLPAEQVDSDTSVKQEEVMEDLPF